MFLTVGPPVNSSSPGISQYLYFADAFVSTILRDTEGPKIHKLVLETIRSPTRIATIFLFGGFFKDEDGKAILFALIYTQTLTQPPTQKPTSMFI